MRTSRVAALLYRRGCTVWQLGLRWHAWQGGFAEHGTVPWVERQHEAAARHTQHRAAVAAQPHAVCEQVVDKGKASCPFRIE